MIDIAFITRRRIRIGDRVLSRIDGEEYEVLSDGGGGQTAALLARPIDGGARQLAFAHERDLIVLERDARVLVIAEAKVG